MSPVDAVEIRLVREGEIDAVAGVIASAFEQYRSRLPHAAEDHAVFERFIDDALDVRKRLEDAEVYVAVESDRVVGTGTLYGPGNHGSYARTLKSPPWPDGWAALRLLAVDPGARGRGIGRMLVEARVRRACELGAAAVGLHTSSMFEHAYAMLPRMGWRRAPAYDHSPAPGIRAEAYTFAVATADRERR